MKKLFLALLCCYVCLSASERMVAQMEGLLNWEPIIQGFAYAPFRSSFTTDPWRPTKVSFFTKLEVLLAEENFNSFCKEFSINSFQGARIPPLVHIIWLGSSPPKTVDLVIESWKKFNPSFEVKLWTDSDAKEFPWSCDRSKMVYETAGTWSEKSDILRFEILYKYGGIYCDTDMMCLNSFQSLLNSGVSFFAGYQYNYLYLEDIGSAIIGAVSGSKVIELAIKYNFTKQEAPYLSLSQRSGPGPLTRACYESILLNEEPMLLLPCSYFFPLPYYRRLGSVEELEKFIKPESLTMHLWEGSWL